MLDNNLRGLTLKGPSMYAMLHAVWTPSHPPPPFVVVVVVVGVVVVVVVACYTRWKCMGDVTPLLPPLRCVHNGRPQMA